MGFMLLLLCHFIFFGLAFHCIVVCTGVSRLRMR
uniref:Uncharacterized protein n=1 Tax=Rhizophora mucronata TaxID=61149 RepID=A0A2P2QT88_RHIMU